MNSRMQELRIWESLNFERAVMRAAVYMLAVCIAIICAFMNIVYGTQFSSTANLQWVASVSIALVAGMSR